MTGDTLFLKNVGRTDLPGALAQNRNKSSGTHWQNPVILAEVKVMGNAENAEHAVKFCTTTGPSIVIVKMPKRPQKVAREDEPPAVELDFMDQLFILILETSQILGEMIQGDKYFLFFSGGDSTTLQQSLARLSAAADGAQILPGHSCPA